MSGKPIGSLVSSFMYKHIQFPCKKKYDNLPRFIIYSLSLSYHIYVFTQDIYYERAYVC